MTTTWDDRQRTGARRTTGVWVAAALVGLLALTGFVVASAYNGLVTLDNAAQSQWAQVENVYQRRLDLVPNLVATVRGAADFERGTLTAVTEARARAGQTAAEAGPQAARDPAALRRYEATQDALTSALTRLMVVVERYPELRATENFRDLQAQLEGTENRIAVERMRYNEAARAYDTARESFPTVLVTRLFGGRFRPRPYFQSRPGADVAPTVRF